MLGLTVYRNKTPIQSTCFCHHNDLPLLLSIYIYCIFTGSTERGLQHYFHRSSKHNITYFTIDRPTLTFSTRKFAVFRRCHAEHIPNTAAHKPKLAGSVRVSDWRRCTCCYYQRFGGFRCSKIRTPAWGSVIGNRRHQRAEPE